MEKRFYTIAELVEMGFSRWELINACHIKFQDFATKSGIPNGRGIWRIDLQKYLAFRQRETKKAVS